jgi:hypothetical protein
MTHEIHFSVPTTDPAAFAAEWAEFNKAVEDSIPPEEPEGVERDLMDMVREHEEEEDRVQEADDLQEWRFTDE